MERIGLLGGTFNPIHQGHLQLARLAYQQCDLDAILFIPAAVPPHKDADGIIDFDHRVAMVERACAGEDDFFCSRIEEQLPSPTYTVDTLRALMAKERYCRAQFFFIIGVDAFIELKTWKEYRTVLSGINIILSPRKSVLGKQNSFLRELGFYRTSTEWAHGQYRSLYELEDAPDNVSSTAVRKNITLNRADEKMLPPVVANYIAQHKLYS